MSAYDLRDLTHQECEVAVIQKIISRREAGRAKYGMTMERTDLSDLDWIRHAQEEAMDLSIYLQRLLREISQVPAMRCLLRECMDLLQGSDLADRISTLLETAE